MSEIIIEGFKRDCNPKQTQFLDAVLAAANGHVNQRYFFYGGAVRGGKTYVCLTAILMLAHRFPGFRAHIVRDSLPNLKQTTLPSFSKLCQTDMIARWRRSDGDYYAELTNGSRIYFFSESFRFDPDLNRFKGLETNIFLLEQIEELQETTLMKAFERTGSWYVSPQPEPLVLATFNPTDNWVKKLVYDRWRNGVLPDDWYFQQALPSDNPYVTKSQWAGWRQMDEINYKRFIEGDWEARDHTGLFAYNFKRQKHVRPALSIDENAPLFLSFDFNLNPMTCIAAQRIDKQFRVYAEFRVENIGVEDFIDRIRPFLPLKRVLYVTGDPAGRNGHVSMRANYNVYKMILSRLELPESRLKLLKSAPSHFNSYIFCNRLFYAPDSVLIDERCHHLIADLERVKFAEQHIDKKDKTAGHLLDALRYFLHLWEWE